MTTILTVYRRFERIYEIIRAWEEQVDNIIVLDNSGSFVCDDVLVLSSNKNLGPQGKYPLSFLGDEIIIYADDDILPKPGLVEDMKKVWNEKRIVSILGKQFTGTSYYTSSCFYGHELKEPLRVDWVGGGCTMVHRRYGAVAVKECPSMTLDDIWWENQTDCEYWIAPTNKYEFLSVGFGEDALHKSAEIKIKREEYYKAHGFDTDKPRLRN